MVIVGYLSTYLLVLITIIWLINIVFNQFLK